MDYRKTINIVKRYAELRKNKKSILYFFYLTLKINSSLLT
jgi:hypothetical protein